MIRLCKVRTLEDFDIISKDWAEFATAEPHPEICVQLFKFNKSVRRHKYTENLRNIVLTCLLLKLGLIADFLYNAKLPSFIIKYPPDHRLCHI